MEEYVNYLLTYCFTCSNELVVTKKEALFRQQICCARCGFTIEAGEAVRNELIPALNAKEEWAWEWFVEIFGLRAKKYLIRRLINISGESAEQIASDALQDLYKDLLDPSKPIGPIDTTLEGYISRAVFNKYIDILRKGKSHLSIEHPTYERQSYSEAQNPLAEHFGSEIDLNRFISQIDLNKFIEDLTPSERVLIKLYIEGHSMKEMCEYFASPLGTVKSRLHRLKKLIKNRIEEGEESD